jgi:predicted nucleotidyltransferase
MINSKLKKKLENIAKKYKLELFILFGSRAKGNFTKDSDWDFAFLSKNNINKESLENDLFLILEDPNIDLIDLSEDILPELEWEIFNKGILINEENKKLFIEFKLQSFFTKIDAQELLYKTRDKFLEI